MAAVNQVYLEVSGTAYPCVLLPADLRLSPADRESYVEIGEGHEPIVARVWMAKSTLDTMPSGALGTTGDTACTLVMSGMANTWPPGASADIGERTIRVAGLYLLSAQVARLAVAEPIYELLLVSAAWWWRWKTPDHEWNVLNAAKTAFVAGASSSAVAVAYSSIVTALEDDLGISLGTLPATPTARPHNVISRRVPAADTLVRLISPLGWHIVANPFGASMAYSVVAFDRTDTTESGNLETLSKYAGIDGDNIAVASRTPLRTAPAALITAFPIYPLPVASGPTTTATRYTTYSSSNPEPPSLTTTETLFVGDHFDVEGKTYTEDLEAIATERAAAYWARALIRNRVWVFAGGYPIVPGKTIRRVRISVDDAPAGWTTTVWQHGLPVVNDGGSIAGGGPKAPHFSWLLQNDGAVYPRDDGRVDLEGSSDTGVQVKITANASGGGQYDGKIMAGASTADGAGNLTLPEGRTVGEDCLILNQQEDGLPTHWLLVNEYANGIIVGMTAEETPRPIVLIDCGVPRSATPQPLGASPEGVVDASTDTWDRGRVTSSDDYGDTPVSLAVTTRVMYDDTAGTPVLYGFARSLIFDTSGRLVSIGAESRYEIDTPEAC